MPVREELHVGTVKITLFHYTCTARRLSSSSITSISSLDPVLEQAPSQSPDLECQSILAQYRSLWKLASVGIIRIPFALAHQVQNHLLGVPFKHLHMFLRKRGFPPGNSILPLPRTMPTPVARAGKVFPCQCRDLWPRYHRRRHAQRSLWAKPLAVRTCRFTFPSYVARC